MLRKRQDGGAEGTLRVGEAEEAVEEAIGQGRAVAEGVLGLRKPEEAVEGRKEAIGPLEIGGRGKGGTAAETRGGANR